MFPARRHGSPSLFFAPPADSHAACSSDDWDDDPPDLDELDDDSPLDLDDECWDALLPDDDYEPRPDPGDFWPHQDAA
jgi:hypothetical protein